MPSPIGHALGGIASGALVSRRIGWGSLACFAAAGAMADLDFLLPLQHRGPSHSVGAAALAFCLTLVTTRQPRLALAVGTATASHTLLDWLGEDTWSPRGLMALWPFSDAFYISGLDVFSSVNRRYWTDGFWSANAVAVLREILLLGPLAVVSTYRIPARSSDPAGPRQPSAGAAGTGGTSDPPGPRAARSGSRGRRRGR